jgi:hypothetical protein
MEAHMITIDLDGPDGNAFALMGYARKAAKALDKDWEPIKERMISGSYDNLLRIFIKEFGELYKLESMDL